MTNTILAFLIFLPVFITTPQISFTNHVFSIANQNGNPNYVSTAPNTVTRFELAKNTAFLAHNPGAGSHFLELVPGDIVVAGQYFTVKRIDYYRVSGNYFINTSTGLVYTGAELFEMYYYHTGGLILQTCTFFNGVDGRAFVVGE
jgi:hypothetical protein